MYSHMCQDFATAAMRVIERMTIKELTTEEHAAQLFCVHLFRIQALFLAISPRKSTPLRYGRAEQISHMDMYANLGDDEAMLLYCGV